MYNNLLSEGQIVHGKKNSYQVERCLEDKPKATVYLASTLGQGLEVVLKQDTNSSPVKGLEREAAVQILIQRNGGHKNILSPYEFIKDERAVVFPYVKGGDLKNLQRRIGKFTPQQAIAALLPLCDAVGYLHSLGVVHRDIKRDNVLLQGTDPAIDEITVEILASAPEKIVPKLYDFDISKHDCISHLDEEVFVYGSLLGMAPEVFRKKDDHRRDIYALGVLLFELLADRSPFRADTHHGIMHNHLYEIAPPITCFNDQVTVSLQEVIEKAFAKDPDKRYQTAAELKRDLEQIKNEL